MIHENTFGELMESNRKVKNVKRTKLCRGLCSIMALSRYENDERMPEKIMADALVERLGIEPYQFEFVLSDEFAREDENFMTASKLVNMSHGGELTEERILLWEDTADKRLYGE